MGSLTKALIGKEDCDVSDNGTVFQQFNRLNSTGSTITLTSFPDVWKSGMDIVNAKYYGAHDATGATLNSAVGQTVNNNCKDIYLEGGEWVISTDYDWSSYTTTRWIFGGGAYLSIAAGCTVTFPTPSSIVASPTQQIFSGAGAISFGASGGTIYPKWWGCVADGTTDDATAFQAMLTAKPDGFTLVDLLGYTYRVDAELTFPDKIHIFNGRVDFSNMGANTELFTCTGSLGTALALTGNATRSDSSLTMAEADAATLSEGDYIWVESAAIVYGDESGTAGEQQRVRSVVGGTVNLYDTLVDSYAVADTATVIKITFKENIEISNFEAVGNGTSNQHVAWFTYCRDVRIHDCRTDKFYQTHWRFHTCREFSVKNCSIFHCQGATNGYGVCAAEGCQFYHLDNNYGEYVRQLIEAGAGTRGVCRFWTANFNEAVGASADGISTHGSCEYGEIRGNRINADIGAAATSMGIFVRGINIIVDGNQIIGPYTYGIYYVPLMSNHGGTGRGFIQITNNTMDFAAGRGIYVYITENEVYRHVDITGNSFYNMSGGIPIHLRIDTGVLRGFHIHRNTVSDVSGAYDICRVETYDAGNLTAGSIMGNVFHRADDLAPNIHLIGTAAIPLKYVSVIGNTCWNGSYGVLGSDTNYNTCIGNIFYSCATADTSGLGANSETANNATA